MAEFGLRVKNINSGTLIIDGQYANLALRTKGTGTASTVLGSAWGFTVQVSGGNPIIAISCSEYCFVGSSASNGVTTFTVTCAVQGKTVDWYVFDDPVNCTPINTRWAFLVRNRTNGRVVFDSRMKYMKVIGYDAVQTNPDQPDTMFINKNYPGPTKIAAAFSQRPYSTDIRQVGAQPPRFIILVYNGALRAQGTVVQGKYLLTQSIEDTSVPTALKQGYFAALVLDVSNL